MLCNFYSLVKKPDNLSSIKVAKIINVVAGELKIRMNWEVTVLLVSPQYIKKLNQQYRQQDKVTDVLSFSQKEGLQLKFPGQKARYLGDIVLCYAQIKKQAKLFNQTVEKEFALLLIHGFLHLMGYEDNTDKQYKKMAKIQDRVLAKIYDRHKKATKKF
jgi:probable rRNA maturation factor